MLFWKVFRFPITTSVSFCSLPKVILRVSHPKIFIGHCSLVTFTNQNCLISRKILTNSCPNGSNLIFCRLFKKNAEAEKIFNDASYNVVYWCLATVFIMIGFSFLSVPFYRFFCEQNGTDNRINIETNLEKIEKMEPVKDRLLRVVFQSHLPSIMSSKWKFKPLQNEIYVRPGETALAFYTAYNPTSRPVVGISSYNIQPSDAGYYFNKIQCFCFEEQLLMPGEEVELPVFFYIDPDYIQDPNLEYINDVVLNYTFFEAKKSHLYTLAEDTKKESGINNEKLVA